MNAKKMHTPGPWRIKTTGNIGNFIEGYGGKKMFDGDEGFRTVAMFQHCEPTGLYANEQANAQANGRLIAAAPELLATLETIEITSCNHCGGNGLEPRAKSDACHICGGSGEVCSRPYSGDIRAAIAKARGEA